MSETHLEKNMNDHLKLIETLQSKASEVLDNLLPVKSSVALLDFPNNTNVGDSLIWLGEIAYLRSRGISLSYVCDVKNYNKNNLMKSLEAGQSNHPIILLNGGGNFGTLWPEVQTFRKRVLNDFAGIPIIQLPQSLHFDNDSELKDTADFIKAHGKFTLLTRDVSSFELARKHFECTVHMCPDMAFFIGSLKSNTPSSHDRLILSRTDHEKKTNWHHEVEKYSDDLTIKIDDWLDSSYVERCLHRVELHTGLIRQLFDKDNLTLLRLWNFLAEARKRRGVKKLQQGRAVITDRLHAHILSILLDKPHILIDNSYGKVGNFYRAWTYEYSNATLVDGVEAAFRNAYAFDTYLKLASQES